MTNTEIAAKLFDAFNNEDWDVSRQYAAGDCHYAEMATGRVTNGIEAWIENSKGWRAAFPDATGTLVSRIASGDKVIEEVIWSGTHNGDMLTPDGSVIPATGKTQKTPAVMISTFNDGKLVAVNHYFDMLGMLAQLGLLGDA